MGAARWTIEKFGRRPELLSSIGQVMKCLGVRQCACICTFYDPSTDRGGIRDACDDACQWCSYAHAHGVLGDFNARPGFGRGIGLHFVDTGNQPFNP